MLREYGFLNFCQARAQFQISTFGLSQRLVLLTPTPHSKSDWLLLLLSKKSEKSFALVKFKLVWIKKKFDPSLTIIGGNLVWITWQKVVIEGKRSFHCRCFRYTAQLCPVIIAVHWHWFKYINAPSQYSDHPTLSLVVRVKHLNAPSQPCRIFNPSTG